MDKLWGAEQKISKAKISYEWANLARIRASLQAVAKMTMEDFLGHYATMHQNKVPNTSSHTKGFESMYFYP